MDPLKNEKVSINQEFGQYIKRLREHKNISLRKMAKEKLNISPTYLLDIENANRPAPQRDILMQIARTFDIDTNKAEFHNFLDLAAKTRSTIPLDVEEFIIANPVLKDFIRKLIEHQFVSVSDVENLLATLHNT